MDIITSQQIVEFVKKALAENWGYVYGGQGQLYTQELAEKWAAEQRAGKDADYFLKDCARWIGHTVVDCSGLLVEAFRSVDKSYGDRTANTLRAQCVERGPISSIPEISGLCVWKSGHIGLYIGGGKVIEAAGAAYGVTQSGVDKTASGRGWSEWGQLADVDYDTPSMQPEEPDDAFYLKRYLKLKSPYMKGDDVRDMQERLMAAGYGVGGSGADGIFGPKTQAGVKTYQKAKKLAADGIVGPKTIGALGGIWVE